MKLAIAAIAIPLASCASYWEPDATMQQGVKAVQYVQAPCGNQSLHGCYMPGLQLIQINSTQPDYVQACARGHEMKHAAGFRHDEWPLFRPNCGEES